jgi:hypothetical protein
MGTKNFSNANDLITFSRSSAGTALRKIAYGSELVTNGTFDTDLSGWTLSNSPAWVSGRVELSRNGGIDIVRQSFATTIGAVYKVTADVTGTSGKLGIGVSSLDDSILSAGALVDTSVDRLFVATTNTTWIYLITEVNGTSSWDNISVKEVLFDDASGDLTLFNHPAGIPRIEYDASGNVLGLLVEEQRTNLVIYSERLETWGKVSVDTGADPVVTANDAIAPDGNLTADKVVFDLGEGASARSYLANTLTTVAGDHSLSVWLKGETGGEQIVARHVGAVAYSLFTLTTEWQRFDLVETSAGGSSSIHLGLRQGVVGTINTQATVYIWGAQLEAGAFPTSYIPTAGATATRSADVASIPVADFGYSKSEGTLVVEARHFDSDSGVSTVASLGDNTVDYVNMYTQYNSYYRIGAEGGDVSSGNIVLNTGGSLSDLSKVATSWENNTSFDAARDGTLGAGYTDFAPFGTHPTTMHLGSRSGTVSFLNGHIKSIRYYPRRLTNAQLQELTT